jgi:hypothetical protein
MKILHLIAFYALSGCDVPKEQNQDGIGAIAKEPKTIVTEESTSRVSTDTAPDPDKNMAAKLTNPNCTDPDLSKVAGGITFMMCDGAIASGTMESPAIDPDLKAENIKAGVIIGEVTGNYSPSIGPDLTSLYNGPRI